MSKNTATKAIPEGFVELSEGLGFTDVLRPLYRREGERPVMGMHVQARHTNMIGICHGGVLMTLSDITASWGVNHRRGVVSAAPTLNLSFDFVSAAREGDWLEAEAELVTVKRRFAFSSGTVRCGEKLVCRFSGGFYLSDHAGFSIDEKLRQRVSGGDR